MTMYSRKLKLRYLHKTTSKSHAIKIYDPIVKRDVITKLGRISLFSIVILITLFAFNWYYVDTGQLLDMVIIHKFEDKSLFHSKEKHLINKDFLVENPEFTNLDNFHRVRFVSIPDDTSLEDYDKNYRFKINQFLIEENSVQQVRKKSFAQVKNSLSKVWHQKLPEPKLITEFIQTSSKITVPNFLQCKKHFNANRLTTGKQGNALDCYRKILLADPTNALAKKGLVKIEQRYQQWAKAAITKGSFKKAHGYLKRLQKVNQKSPALPRLRRLLISSKKLSSKKLSSKKSKPVNKTTQHKLQPPKKKVVKQSPHTIKKTPNLQQCNDIFSQESLGIRTLTSKQKQFKQQRCK